MEKVEIISCVTNELRYYWETAVYLNNLSNLGYKDITILVFVNKDTQPLEDWKRLESLAKFYYYYDKGSIEKIGNSFHYKPVYRFWLLQEHFKKYSLPYIFYTDTDIILTKYLDLNKFVKGDINYLSWTGSKDRKDNYLWQPYFDSKIERVKPESVERFKKLDVLSRLGFITGTTREVITENNLNTGGAQYLLKNINSQFWTDCFNVCCEIKLYLSEINQNFMQGATANERENGGFQSFTSDMIALLYTLWKYNKKTECPLELDFAWSTDRVERLDEVYILHNAGITAEANVKIAFEKDYIEAPLFFKGEYQDYTPWDKEEKLNTIINNPISLQFANAEYVKEIIKAKHLKCHKTINLMPTLV